MGDPSSDNVWVVVRVRKGSSALEDSSVHTGFTNPLPAHLLCDILSDKNRSARFEYRVVEMPRFRLQSFRPYRAAS